MQFWFKMYMNSSFVLDSFEYKITKLEICNTCMYVYIKYKRE